MGENCFSGRMKEYQARIEEFLAQLCTQQAPYHRLLEAMRYSLLAGGKRLRPVLTLEFCRLCGGDMRAALPVACSLELLHTYSLIHDDLPCMDDDDLRRGKPSNHKVFGEYTAVLAGDALQSLAFRTVLCAPLPPDRVLRCTQYLADAAGVEGICGGQQLDLEWEGRPLDRGALMEIHHRKTSALIRAACCMGVAAAGGAEEQETAAAQYAESFGLAFQIRDDMLDVIGNETTFGKPIGSDRAEEKTTFVDILGLGGCEREIARLTADAVTLLQEFSDPGFLIALTRSMEKRDH